MNRILFTIDETGTDGVLKVDGQRANHVLRVLHTQVGQTVRVGMIGGPVGIAEVVDISGDTVSLLPSWGEAPPRTRISLLLALPRPKVMRRLWAQLASMGVARIVLTNAAKVERNYFDTHWLHPDHYQPKLLEGLQQSGDTQLPLVTVERRLKPFIEDTLEGAFPRSVRLVAHPRDERRFDQVDVGDRDLLLAVGPEGGWTDFELELLRGHGFETFCLGWRTLRTDTACVALLALAHNLMGTT